MATYFVLENSVKNNEIRIAVHVDVPTGDNDVGTPWQQALVEHLDSTQSVVPWISAGQQAALDDGSKYEFVRTFEDDANKTPTERKQALEAYLQNEITLEGERLKNLLRFWGLEVTV